jgi:CheY-like chemotaxis protein
LQTKPSVAAPILIVENHTTAREGLALALEQEGFRTVQAANGVEALTYLSEGGPAELILLDLMMPDMDGWTFRRAQQRDPWLADIPIIVTSVLEGRPLGGLAAAASFRKPIDLDALIGTVHTLCADRERARQGAALRSSVPPMP